MQVLSCQRAASLITVRWPVQAAIRASSSQNAAVPRYQCGFTLVELLVTLTIATILIMFAVPSFKNITLSNRLTTSANSIVTAISIAKMEAIKRNVSTQLCSNSSNDNSADSDILGGACGTDVGAVWARTGSTLSPILAGTPGLVAPIEINGNSAALRFNPQGLARKVGETGLYGDTVIDICTSQMSSKNHRVIRMVGGSILETTTSSGGCPQ